MMQTATYQSGDKITTLKRTNRDFRAIVDAIVAERDSGASEQHAYTVANGRYLDMMPAGISVGDVQDAVAFVYQQGMAYTQRVTVERVPMIPQRPPIYVPATSEYVSDAETFDKLDSLIVSTDKITGKNRLARPSDLIHGILSVGGVMMVAAPPKAGKSWSLEDLAYSLCDGGFWMDVFKCESARVLYVNLELQGEWLSNRLDEIRKSGGYGGTFDTMTLRGGDFEPIQSLRRYLRECRPHDYDAIILDPIYMFEDGPENDQDTIMHLMQDVGGLATDCHSAVIFSHHFSKGNPTLKEPMDRAAGSGVFHRYIDQGVTFTPMQVAEGTKEHDWMTSKYGEGARAYRFETSSRNYGDNAITSVIWQYPRFHADLEHMLDGAPLKGSMEAGRQMGSRATAQRFESERNKKDEATRLAIESCEKHGERPMRRNVYGHLKDHCERLGIKYPTYSTFEGWTKKGGPTHYRPDQRHGNELRPVDLDVVDEEGNNPFLPSE